MQAHNFGQTNFNNSLIIRYNKECELQFKWFLNHTRLASLLSDDCICGFETPQIVIVNKVHFVIVFCIINYFVTFDTQIIYG